MAVSALGASKKAQSALNKSISIGGNPSALRCKEGNTEGMIIGAS